MADRSYSRADDMRIASTAMDVMRGVPGKSFKDLAEHEWARAEHLLEGGGLEKSAANKQDKAGDTTVDAHAMIARSLMGKASASAEQGQYGQAEQLRQRAQARQAAAIGGDRKRDERGRFA